MATSTSGGKIESLLGAKAESLLGFKNPKISKDRLHLPSPTFVDDVYAITDRNIRVLTNLQRMFGHGRLRNTGYLSILPVDQGIEHSAGASFAKNPDYFDGENIVKLAVEGGCNAVASTFGVLGSVARKYAHKIPFIVKMNHNELLTYPNQFNQVFFGTVQEAWDMGAAAVGARLRRAVPDMPPPRPRQTTRGPVCGLVSPRLVGLVRLPRSRAVLSAAWRAMAGCGQ